ncbi:maleylpyruvate isomerase N-terminal domain-containing protein, partial [Phytoactinopolyspora endophytica]|uniref:maleylpyruvate isomerase N-terminal domain-containing protein n=1 Tax=Phytoactinopolyspora endophytica TaxID=1642495 RepID=UPI00101CD4AA
MAKRADPAKAWDVYREGHAVLREWLETLPYDAWKRDSALSGWTIADLAAHIAMVGESIAALTEAPRGVVAKSLADYITGYAPAADVISGSTLQITTDAGRKPAEILKVVDARFAEADARIENSGLRDEVVQARRGPIRMGDFLLTRVIEIVVHGDDFARSLPDMAPPVMPRGVQRAAVRALLDVLAERAPGRTVEVRIPPHAAVQCVEGPRHT